VSFHMVNARTGNRLRRQYVDEQSGDPVERDEQVRGYETAKNTYVILEPEEIAAAVPEADKRLSIEDFIACGDVDTVYFDKPYFVTPADEAAQEAFALMREGMRRQKVAALARAVWTAGVDSLVITKVDVLDTLPEIKVAVGYRRGADRVDHLPASFPEEPPAIEWKTFPGWRRPTGDCRRFEDLPAPCRDYIAWIGAATGCAIRMVSVGPDRAQTIVLDRPLRATPP